MLMNQTTIDNGNVLVSVIVPTYNHASHLGRALRSVFKQTYENWELIVVDNHSTDNTEALVESFSSFRIKYLKINNHGVIAASRNAGIEAAEGEWIAFLDADDFWSEDKIESCLTMNGVDFIYHQVMLYKVKNENTVEIFCDLNCRDVSNDPYKNLLGSGPAPQTSSVIVKRQCLLAVNGFDEHPDLVGGEDYDLWVRLAQSGCKFGFLPAIKSYYLTGGNHVTAPHRSLSIVDYLSKKYFESFSQIPDWMHKSVIASNIKLKRYYEALRYTKKIFFRKSFLALIRVYILLLTSRVGK